MIDLKKNPFYLQDEDIAWVEKTKKSMTLEEKIGQLFIAHGYTDDEKLLSLFMDKMHYGGFMYRPASGASIQKTHRYLQSLAKVPLLFAANLEFGGNGIAADGTSYGQQMEVAATDDEEYAYRLGKISCTEGQAVGVQWAFAPVVDIDYNFRNPITNVRTYGSDPERVRRMGKAYVRGAKEAGTAVAVKHFPGDGRDERDQHIAVTVNDLSCEEWDKTYGSIYRDLIKDGAQTIMVGSIAMPAYVMRFNPEAQNPCIPASLSKELLQGLLRDRLGFNGLIVSDSTVMVGLSAVMPRREMVPALIESGCDMFLFCRDDFEDYDFMMEGYRNGLLSEKRLDEAMTRILALKASLGLHKKQAQGTLVPEESELKVLRQEEHERYARECADRAVTLVKGHEGILPLSTEKYKKILLEVVGTGSNNERIVQSFLEKLISEGFQVTLYEGDDFSNIPGLDNVARIREKYDLVLYVGNEENTSNKTVTRIKWNTVYGLGNNTPWFAAEVPTMFISLANPYHLIDVPMIRTYINAYSNNEYVIDAVMEKIMGRSEFQGISPVDPFCGREDTKW